MSTSPYSPEASASTCPICAFIEAGPCGDTHKTWVACREAAKEAGKDYVDECHETFKAFLTCTLKHDEYYEPFLEMLNLGGDAGAAAAEGGGDVEDQQQEASAQRSSTGGGSQHGGQQQQQHHHQRSSSSGGIGAAAG